MPPLDLQRLRERLLKEGISPRYVQRYLRELRDHYQDALREELAKGQTRGEAEHAARVRLGDEAHLAYSVLAQPQLRSIASQYPKLIFGVAPVLFWIAAAWVVAFWLVPVVFSAAGITDTGPQTPWPFVAGYASFILYARFLPVLLGAAAFIICARQRLSFKWPLAGFALVAILSGTLSVTMTLPTATELGMIGISTSLLPFFFSNAALGPADTAALLIGLARAAAMLAICLIPYVVWRMKAPSVCE